MNRKAIMGIGTLIIFIATILVAAVAAGVIISTSGVLQQKALLVGEQSRNRLINGMQITHVFMAGNTTEKTANNIEILARPEPASGPINLKTTSLSFFTDTGAYSADLSHEETIEIDIGVTPALTDGSWEDFGDLDEDGITDQVQLNLDGTAADDTLLFNLSGTGLTDSVDLTIDIDTVPSEIDLEDLVIAGNGTVYGYVHINDTSPTNGQINANSMNVTDQFVGDCTFAKLRPEESYCIVTLTGTDDTALEYGETMFIYFKLTDANKLDENDEFEIKIFPQDGRSTYILDRVPQVIYKVRLNVYP